LIGAWPPATLPLRAALFFAACLIVSAAYAAERPRVILVGDSTLAPRTGYGDALCGLFLWQVDCVNLARGGRSTKSYRADGSWDRVAALLGDGSPRKTYVLVQFGHNDQPGKAERTTDLATEFPANLRGYIAEIRAGGAEPVLGTPLTRRQFRGAELADDLGPWAEAIRTVARDSAAPLIDVHARSSAAVAALGEARADALAMAPPPDKTFDRTHVGPKGAALFARIAAREIAATVPALGAHLVVGAVEPAGPIARPQMDAARAREHSYSAVLGGWDPLSSPLAKDAKLRADLVVDRSAADGRRTFASVQAAVNAAVGESSRTRVHILVRPGIYDERVTVPAAPVAITLYGEGDARAVRIRANVAVRALGSPDSGVMRVHNHGFEAKNLTVENAHNKDRGDARDQMQAVALILDDADRAHFENVRLIGFQDTLYAHATSPRRPARAFFHRSYIEGDMDFICGEATVYFLATEVRSLGDRTVSYVLAPATHVESRHGFVFESSRFTHDGSPNALGGAFKLARQWFRSPEHVGKVAILNSFIGAHIDAERPWADWSIGTPRHRPVQYGFLAEYNNTGESP
jgi:pectin methylesterase-like acyl-CoA thioesterase/lysophospholipase L1-like esterase